MEFSKNSRDSVLEILRISQGAVWVQAKNIISIINLSGNHSLIFTLYLKMTTLNGGRTMEIE